VANIDGTGNSDTINGTSSDDVIRGFGGNDLIDGGSGADLLEGGDGNDTLIGGANNDTLVGGAGSDVFSYLSRGFGFDAISDLTAGDRISVSALGIGDFTSLSPYMTESINGVEINLEWGGYGERILIQGASLGDINASFFIFDISTTAKVVNGTSSDDVVFGGLGNDSLVGEGGRDELNGGAGADTLVGAGNDDLLRGGAGNDVFAFSDRYFGVDVIADFTVGDKIDLRNFNIADMQSLAPYMTETIQGARFTFEYGGYMERFDVRDVMLGSLSASDFVFATTTTGVTVSGTSSRDVLFGGLGNDTLTGNGGSDDLNGGAGNDTLIGSGGDDLLRGGAGNDRFAYIGRSTGIDVIADFSTGDRIDLSDLNIGDFSVLTPYLTDSVDGPKLRFMWNGYDEGFDLRNVTFSALTAADFIFSTSTVARTVTGTSSSDVLFGGNGNDTLNGGNSADDLNGGSGNDLINGGEGNDLLRGGAGTDIFTYGARYFGKDVIADFVVGDRIDLTSLFVADFETILPYLSSTAEGTLFSIEYNGYDEQFLIKNVALSALSASNFVFNTTTASLTVSGTSSSDVLFGGNGNDTILGGFGVDKLNGGAGNDVLRGEGWNDVLRGGAGNDTLEGGDDDDVLIGGIGSDSLNGGAGFDVADVSDTSSNIFLNYSSLSLPSFVLGADTLTAVESVILGTGNDTVLGTALADSITTGGGNDWISAALGNDTIEGGIGSDTIVSGDGNDWIWAGNKTVVAGTPTSSDVDYVYAGAGNDRIVDGGMGIDVLLGEAGDDTINDDGGTFTYLFGGSGSNLMTSDAQINVFLSEGSSDLMIGDNASYYYRLAAGSSSIIGGAGTDQFVGGAVASNDAVLGGAGNDYLFGGDGNDVLAGEAGNDVIIGQNGNDTLDGGAGVNLLWANDAGNDQIRVLVSDGGTQVIEFFEAGGLNDVVRIQGSSLVNFAGIQNLVNNIGVAQGANLMVNTGAGAQLYLNLGANQTSIWFQGVSAYSLTAADFLFS
jgi:Ca2+-binding RTX toxin-like protein